MFWLTLMVGDSGTGIRLRLQNGSTISRAAEISHGQHQGAETGVIIKTLIQLDLQF